jgi:hypothetical protein
MNTEIITKIEKEIETLRGRIYSNDNPNTEYVHLLRGEQKGLENALVILKENTEIVEDTADDFKVNFASSIMEFKLKSPEILVDKFIGFINDTHILTNYHHDYSNEEMIGIIKFLTPLFTFDENIRLVNERFNTSLGKKLRESQLNLEVLRDKELLNLLLNARNGKNNDYIDFLERRKDKIA